MVERISERERNDFRPFEKFVAVRGISGDVPLIHAGGAQDPPLVMIAGQPYLGQVVEPPVLGNVPGRKMSVIVDDRQGFCEAVIEIPRESVPEQEIGVYKWGSHVRSSAATALRIASSAPRVRIWP